MNDGYSLLRAIEANPDEDTPRLAYADWLDEHAVTDADRARAEFIRAQCELARAVAQGEALGALNIREREAVAPYCGEWVKQFPVKLGGLRFDRGFIVPLYIDAVDWFRAADSISAVAPLLELNLRAGETFLHERDMRLYPAFQFVRKLTLSGKRLVASLGSADRLRNLFSLDVSCCEINSAQCEVLANVSFPTLRQLVLTRNPIMNRGLAAMRQATWFRQLESLALDNCEVSDVAVAALVSDPQAASLRRLILGPFVNSDDIALALLTSPHLSRIDHLRLHCDGMSERMQTALKDRFAGKFHLNRFQFD